MHATTTSGAAIITNNFFTALGTRRFLRAFTSTTASSRQSGLRSCSFSDGENSSGGGACSTAGSGTNFTGPGRPVSSLLGRLIQMDSCNPTPKSFSCGDAEGGALSTGGSELGGARSFPALSPAGGRKEPPASQAGSAGGDDAPGTWRLSAAMGRSGELGGGGDASWT